MADNLIGNASWLDLAGPADHTWDSIRAFPVRVFLVTEGGHCAVRPAVHVRTVVGAVHHEGIVGDTGIVESLQNGTDVLVMVDHAVCIFSHPASRLPLAFGLHMSPEMHMGEVHPYEERLICFGLSLDEVDRSLGDIVVNRFHSLLCQWPRILDDLLSNLAESWIVCWIVLVRGFGIQDAAWTIPCPERRIFRVVGKFRLFFGVQVIEIAIEFIETVDGRQEFISIAEVILAELAADIAKWLQEFCDCRIFFAKSECRTRQTDFRKPGSQSVLARDK